MSIACRIRVYLCALLLTMSAATSFAQGGAEAKPFLHPLFTDHMVLQRGIAAPVWGWTAPGTKVTVSMGKKTVSATADAEGKWLAKIGPFPAGGPYTLTIAGPQTVMLQDVLVGDVWVCSGQSNMQMGIGLVNNAKEEIAQANHPNIRICLVPPTIGLAPKSTVGGSWAACTPESIAAGGWGGFSAVGYFFGRELEQQLQIPIGLIDASWGGTVAQAWTSKEGLTALPEFDAAVKQVVEIGADHQGYIARIAKGLQDWWALDPGTVGNWGTKADLDTSAWKTMTLPGNWEAKGLPDYNGAVWFSTVVDLPQDWAGKQLVLHFGNVDERDVTYFNGVRIGGCDYYWQARNYPVPAKLVKAGGNVITVRVLDIWGNGGFIAKPEQLSLELPGTQATPISLAGEWKYQPTVNSTEHPYPPERIDGNPNNPTVLFNGMIHPLLPMAIKGAIWYQGESNAGNPKQYQALLPAMIQDWRARFGVGDFPFYIVQLANFMAREAQPADPPWARLREAQTMTAMKVRNCGLAVTIDIGDAADIHPKNKQDVGKRLALNALAQTYKKRIEYSGPTFRAMKVEGQRIRLSFDHVAGGLIAKGTEGKLTGFAIAGADKKFVWAEAVIEGKTVVVSSPQVAEPVAVRYAWGNNPECNLYNKADLPAGPFRTDND